MSCGQFMAQHPEVKIEMQLQDQQELHSRLKRGEIDIFVSEEKRLPRRERYPSTGSARNFCKSQPPF